MDQKTMIIIAIICVVCIGIGLTVYFVKEKYKSVNNLKSTMGAVTFSINNNTSYLLKVQSSNGLSAVVNPGTSAQLSFTPADTNITNAMRWYNMSDLNTAFLQGSVNWSDGGSGADDGWTTSSIICMSGNMNGQPFSGCNEGWIELQPFNLMANGGTVSVTYTNA